MRLKLSNCILGRLHFLTGTNKRLTLLKKLKILNTTTHLHHTIRQLLNTNCTFQNARKMYLHTLTIKTQQTRLTIKSFFQTLAHFLSAQLFKIKTKTLLLIMFQFYLHTTGNVKSIVFLIQFPLTANHFTFLGLVSNVCIFSNKLSKSELDLKVILIFLL